MVRAHIITIIAVIALSGCASSDERAFNAAAKQNTVESYSEFLHNYPDSIHRSEALALKDDATFSEIKRINSKSGYDAYISHYPTGRHVTEAKALREQIALQEQQRRCKYAKAAGNTYKGVVAALNGFLSFARGDNVAEDAAWGWNAASNQLAPKAIDIACD